MSEITMELSFPLDDEDFFRRECPFCCREFKVLLTEDERTTLVQKELASYMLDTQEDTENTTEDGEADELTCPYCGQQAPEGSWWTQEQLAYIGVVARNIIASIVNEQLILPLKRMSRKHSHGLISLRFEGDEMKQQEPWMSPEMNDMEIFDLPCCQRKVKIEEKWTSAVYCFFCGFLHEP